jgi:hypothetical protein
MNAMLIETRFVLVSLLIVLTTLNSIEGRCTFFKSYISNGASFQYNCDISTIPNDPNLPTITKKSGFVYSDFTVIDLSPNVFLNVPIEALCKFTDVETLDLSMNQLTNLTKVFQSLKCMKKLVIIDFSSNYVSTPIKADDFDDSMAMRIESLNLTSNRIQSIETKAFFTLDNQIRFKRLKYLGLALNKIRQLDLLWPLAIPSRNLFIDMKLNPIESLINEMGVTFRDPLFNNPMTGDRFFDITTNNLQIFDDSNILQYGLMNVNDMKDFLTMISNYDLRQRNGAQTFQCYCPDNGSFTNTWFQAIMMTVNLNYPIYQLYCLQYQGRVFVFNFICPVSFCV